MGEKSARKNTSKTAATRTLKEKRNDKKAKDAKATSMDAVSEVKKR